VSVLLVEDHPAVRYGLRTLIDAQPDLTVVAEADSVTTALALAARHRPRVVVLPLRLEGAPRGVELCRALLAAPDPPRVLVYTSSSSTDEATAAFLSGAHSYVHKGEAMERLLDTLRATAAGRRVWLLGPDPAGAAGRRPEGAPGPGAGAGPQVDTSRLTARERDVLGLLLQRLTNAEIAATLHVELPTVKTHVSHILAKLGVANRRGLF